MAQRSFPAHPRSRFANPIPRPHCSSQARLYHAPTLSLNVRISNNEEAPALHISAARRTNARLQDPTDRLVRSNSGGIGRRDAKTRPDNQLRADRRLHAHRLPERKTRPPRRPGQRRTLPKIPGCAPAEDLGLDCCNWLEGTAFTRHHLEMPSMQRN
jgi:hypothetical protein